MKNKNTRKSFSKFSKRNVHKRKGKEKARAALMRAVMETGVGTDSLKINDIYDSGRRARVSMRVGRDEMTLRGIFSSSKQGFGFVTPEGAENERDIFIPEDKTRGAIDGDLVEIIYHKYTSRMGEEKTEGRVTKIVEFGRKTLIGTLVYEENSYRRGRRFSRKLILIPDESRIYLRPVVVEAMGANEGDKVEIKLSRIGSELEGEVIRNFGKTDSREANYEAILAEYEIPTDFTPAELAEAEFFASEPILTEGRKDRTGEIIFTIDGAGAKDLDDAVSLKKTKGGWLLGVHIADVSHYVRERTHLDRAVMARGTSVYFTDKVVPMLPPSISNGAASLGAGEEKYTLSAIISISERGVLRSVKLEPSVIKSRVRGVYSEVNAIFDGTADSAILKKYRSVIPTLERMRELYGVLKEKSDLRGALELEVAEAEILLNENGEPIDIVKRERAVAERMIEQFMLAANEAVASYLWEKKIPCVYRVHEDTPTEKFGEFLLFIHNLGFNTAGINREKPDPRELRDILIKAEEKELITPVSYSLLRSMAKAKYSENKMRHFGLGIENYCHFTSPIRRLSDLATHRIIHKVLLEGKRPEIYSAYAKRAAAAATEAELRALGAERRIENLYKVIYMKDRVGEEFDARVSSITSFGLFAELENTCEGLVPISELDGMYIYDECNITLRSREHIYHLGDRVRVRLEEADIIRGKLRFSIVN